MASDYSQALVQIYNAHSSTWVKLPTPSEYEGQASTIVDSARNSGGYVVCNIIRSDVASISLTWNFLTIDQYKTIAQLFEPLYNGSFINRVYFWDSVKGDFNGNLSDIYQCKQMYCGDRKVSVAHIKLDNSGKPIGYTGVQLDLVEV